jgi:glutamine amidotransferase
VTGIIDYGAGNTASVGYALSRLEADFIVSSSVKELEKCDRLILPGVGSARFAMESLKEKGLINLITAWEKPFLGICLGMQLLFDHSEEGDTSCLGIIPGECLLFDRNKTKVPLMGWNKVTFNNSFDLFAGVKNGEWFYFAHSYYIPLTEYTIAESENDGLYSAAIRKDNFFGVQFHPEKSSVQGKKLLDNFVKMEVKC